MYVLCMVVFMGLLPFPGRLFFALSVCVWFVVCARLRLCSILSASVVLSRSS